MGVADHVAEHIDNLNKELDVFKKIFNRRVVYFAALQEISDSVGPLSLSPEFLIHVADLSGHAASL